MKEIKAIYKLKRRNVFLSGYPVLQEVNLVAYIDQSKYTQDELLQMAKEANPYSQQYEFDRIEGLV